MDTSTVVQFLTEMAFILSVFGVMLAVAFFKGKQAIINVILGLYLGLFFAIEFPYYDAVNGSASGEAVYKIGVFVFFTAVATWLFARLMPREFSEGFFEGFFMKMLFAAAATVLVMSFSFHALPVTELIDPGPIQTLFAPEEGFFYWLLLPIVILFFL